MTDYPYILYVPSPDAQQVFVPQGEPEPPDPPIPTTEPHVVLSVAGMADITLMARDGLKLDPYHDPMGQFVMDCIVCTSPELPGFRAIYRPDQNSTREEWIFEYGDPWTPPPSASLPQYIAQVFLKNGNQETVDAAAGHYWFSRWRWQSKPRAVRRTHAQLAALNYIPYMDTAGLATGAILTVADYTPMAYCGIPKEQGQTGGYPGLGIQTGWQTQFLVRGAPESSFRNQAEAAGTFQAHVRDTHTWAPIDIVDDYPTATMYSSNTGNPYIPRGPRENSTDNGHMPSTQYVPFMLTGDPYYLEGNQFWANQNMLSLPGNGSRFMVAGRYLAWPLRAIHECFMATPDTVPSWLLPKSYWQYWLDKCRGFIEARMANTSDPFMYVFHTVQEAGQNTDLDPVPSGDHVWQQNMLDLVGAWIASTRVEWKAPAEWLMRSSVARASATSGWCRARPSPYHLRMQNASVLREAMDTGSTVIKLQYPQHFTTGMRVKIDSEWFTLQCPTNGYLDWTFNLPRVNPAAHPVKRVVWGDKCQSWTEAAELNVLTYNWTDTGDNDHLSPNTTDLTYPSYQRAALAQGLHAGLDVPGLLEAYNFLDTEMRRFVSTKKLPVGDNWCTMPAVSVRSSRRVHSSDASDVQFNLDMRRLIDEFRQDEPELT